MNKSKILKLIVVFILFFIALAPSIKAGSPVIFMCTSDSDFSVFYSASKACNGINNYPAQDDRWISGPGTGVHWLQANLTTDFVVRDVVVSWGDMSGITTNLRIQTWNGTTWADKTGPLVATDKGTNSYFLVTPTTTSAIRIIQDGSTQTTMQVAEIVVNGTNILPSSISIIGWLLGLISIALFLFGAWKFPIAIFVSGVSIIFLGLQLYSETQSLMIGAFTWLAGIFVILFGVYMILSKEGGFG